MKTLEDQPPQNFANAAKLPVDRSRNVFVRNLPVQGNEKENNQVTVSAVQTLFKEGLKLKDMKVVSAIRHPGGKNGKPGGVTVTLESSQCIGKIFKAKPSLRQNDQYKTVFIENDLSIEARIAKNNLHTLLKISGKEKEYSIKGLKMVKKE